MKNNIISTGAGRKTVARRVEPIPRCAEASRLSDCGGPGIRRAAAAARAQDLSRDGADAPFALTSLHAGVSSARLSHRPRFTVTHVIASAPQGLSKSSL